MRRVPLLAVVTLLAAVALPSAGATAKANERVLVVLASSGVEPYPVTAVQRAFAQANDFLQRASFGQIRLEADVTPWLTGLTARPSCNVTNSTVGSVVAPARQQATNAGFDPSAYDIVFYELPDARCGFFGATFGHEVMLTREPTVELLAHELGHTFGLGHGLGADCTNLLRCGLRDPGDLYTPMGTGSLDFSAYEKSLLGWIPPQPHVTAPRQYVLAPPTGMSRLPQAFLVDTPDGTWWIEYRTRPFRGLLFRFVDANNHSEPFDHSAMLILKPTKHARPWIVKGETYRIPSSWRVTLTKVSDKQATVRFRP